MDQPLELKFHPHTISHLGVSLYSTLPPVIAELVANAWDANAKKVTIDLQNSNGRKSIVVSDDGDGMSLSELGENFLVIGRNRRRLQQQESRRKPIGKKGIGKLSVFGISEHIRIETIQDHKKNIIELNYKEIIKCQQRCNSSAFQRFQSSAFCGVCKGSTTPIFIRSFIRYESPLRLNTCA